MSYSGGEVAMSPLHYSSPNCCTLTVHSQCSWKKYLSIYILSSAAKCQIPIVWLVEVGRVLGGGSQNLSGSCLAENFVVLLSQILNVWANYSCFSCWDDSAINSVFIKMHLQLGILSTFDDCIWILSNFWK